MLDREATPEALLGVVCCRGRFCRRLCRWLWRSQQTSPRLVVVPTLKTWCDGSWDSAIDAGRPLNAAVRLRADAHRRTFSYFNTHNTVSQYCSRVQVKAPRDLMRYIVPKGFIAVDGTSLTVCEVDNEECWFTFMLVAYTQASGTLSRCTYHDFCMYTVRKKNCPRNPNDGWRRWHPNLLGRSTPSTEKSSSSSKNLIVATPLSPTHTDVVITANNPHILVVAEDEGFRLPRCSRVDPRAEGT